MSTITRAKSKKPAIAAVVPYFGSNRMLAAAAGEELAGCPWVGMLCCGSCPELVYIEARTVAVADLHPHLINLLKVMSDRQLGPRLYRSLRRMIFHGAMLKEAQERCRWRETLNVGGSSGVPMLFGESPTVVKLIPSDDGVLQWAIDYFICSWMARSACAGTKGEFSGDICTRWEAGGGDSATRFHNAVRGIPAWRRILRRCTFEVIDVFAFLKRMMQTVARIAEKSAQVGDPHIVEHGLYLDPPFPGPGDAYKFSFTLQQHRELARVLTHEVWGVRIVCRFYDVPLIRELYPEKEWRYRLLEGGRKQTNESAPEILLIKGGPGGVK